MDAVGHSSAFPHFPHGLSVVVIDDEALIGRLLRRLLPGNDVVTFVSSRAALAALARAPSDAIILFDAVMPELSAAEALDDLRCVRPDLVNRVIWMTGGAMTQASEQFLRRNGRHVLLKPFALDQLDAALRDVADSSGHV